MQVFVKGKLDRDVIQRAVDVAASLLPFPSLLELYFFDEVSYCEDILSTLHKHVRESFRQVCFVEQSNFSFTHRNRNLVVISLEGKKDLVRDQKALVGLILHEVMHVMQTQRGIYEHIYRAYHDVFSSIRRRFSSLHYPSSRLQSVLSTLGSTTILLLKDLFCNSELIKKGYGPYLIAYYKTDLSETKTCPRPVFYKKFKDAVQKNLEVLRIVFEFEFSLLSIVLPFQKYGTHESARLVRHVNDCYEINIKEISRKCHDLVGLYQDSYAPTAVFTRRFFTTLFTKVYGLLA